MLHHIFAGLSNNKYTGVKTY